MPQWWVLTLDSFEIMEGEGGKENKHGMRGDISGGRHTLGMSCSVIDRGSQRRSILREVYNPKDKEERPNVPLEEQRVKEISLTSHQKARERI